MDLELAARIGLHGTRRCRARRYGASSTTVGNTMADTLRLALECPVVPGPAAVQPRRLLDRVGEFVCKQASAVARRRRESPLSEHDGLSGSVGTRIERPCDRGRTGVRMHSYFAEVEAEPLFHVRAKSRLQRSSGTDTDCVRAIMRRSQVCARLRRDALWRWPLRDQGDSVPLHPGAGGDAYGPLLVRLAGSVDRGVSRVGRWGSRGRPRPCTERRIDSADPWRGRR